MKQALDWSEAVNKAIEGMVRGVPPFPFVRESLEKLSPRADILVVSATPQEALVREWEEHRARRLRDGHLRPGERHEEAVPGHGLEVSAKIDR